MNHYEIKRRERAVNLNRCGKEEQHKREYETVNNRLGEAYEALEKIEKVQNKEVDKQPNYCFDKAQQLSQQEFLLGKHSKELQDRSLQEDINMEYDEKFVDDDLEKISADSIHEDFQEDKKKTSDRFKSKVLNQ